MGASFGILGFSLGVQQRRKLLYNIHMDSTEIDFRDGEVQVVSCVLV